MESPKDARNPNESNPVDNPNDTRMIRNPTRDDQIRLSLEETSFGRAMTQ